MKETAIEHLIVISVGKNRTMLTMKYVQLKVFLKIITEKIILLLKSEFKFKANIVLNVICQIILLMCVDPKLTNHALRLTQVK